MSRIVRFHKTGGPEVLEIENVDLGATGQGEVKIRVHALGLNRAESMFRSGAYLETATFPARIGYEAAGEIEAIGPGVQGLSVGDAVSTVPAFSMSRYRRPTRCSRHSPKISPCAPTRCGPSQAGRISWRRSHNSSSTISPQVHLSR